MGDLQGTIFHIQRFSIHDGPGIRTTVFFKGCPLRCFWCHNPEGLHKAAEIQFDAARCVACGECVRICPQGAQELTSGSDGAPMRVYHRELCRHCGQCVQTCFAEGLQWIGQTASVEQVLAEIRRDRAFYAPDKSSEAGFGSPGGVTLSGGEPMLQPNFALEILRGCRAEDIHTALETSTYYRWETLENALPLVDLLMIDIKHMDPLKHRAATGVSNEQILANLRRLAPTGKPIIFRTPVIPGVNDTEEEIGAIAGFVRALADTPLADGTRCPGRFSLELLAFHKLAADKYRSLGLDYPAAHLEPPTHEQMDCLAQAAMAQGITVRVR